MESKKRVLKRWKIVIQGLPLAGAAATNFLPLPRLEQQFVMLIVLLWSKRSLSAKLF
jgi:hypothetical protein